MKVKFFFGVTIVASVLALNCSKVHRPDAKDNTEVLLQSTFVNPIMPSGADPWVVEKDGYYYYLSTMGNKIVVRRTLRMSSLSYSYQKNVWTPPAGTPYSENIWAPEMHFIQGKWYIYFAADDGNDANHRMYVLENGSEDPLEGDWEFKGMVGADPDRWAIDGTVLQYNNSLYFIWSGWDGLDAVANSGIQQLYIAKMSNPWTLEGSRVKISEPEFSWESDGLVNEGPEILKNKDGRVFLIYSGSGCWTDDYSLGMLALGENGDPLSPSDWTKSPEPLFTTNFDGQAFGPGHCGFFKSPDGQEDWLIYHAKSLPNQGCANRDTRMQKFTWNPDGTPYFGEPVKIDSAIAKPSGWEL